MATIKDLEFGPHPCGLDGCKRAVIRFPNGFGASVITGPQFYTTDDAPYEIAVLGADGITYSTPITDDVLGYQTEEEADRVLAAIQALMGPA